MRFILAAMFFCVAGMSQASALPTASLNSLSLSKASPIVQVAKHTRPHARRSSGSGGIHPLVGSGAY